MPDPSNDISIDEGEVTALRTFLNTQPVDENGNLVISEDQFKDFVNNHAGIHIPGMEFPKHNAAPLTAESEEAFRNAAQGGLEIAGSVALPEIMGPAKLMKGAGLFKNVWNLMRASGEASTGKLIGKQVAQAAEIAPPSTLEEDAQELGTDTATGTAFGVIPTAFGSMAGTLARKFPNTKLAQRILAQEPGAIAAIFNAPGRNIAREYNLVDDVIPNEDLILKLDPTRGIDFEKPGAMQQFIKNIDNIKESALAAKQAAFRSADEIAKAGKLGKLTFTPDDIAQAAQQASFNQDTAAQFAQDSSEFLLGKKQSFLQSVYKESGTELAAKEFTAEDAYTTLKNINNRIKATGYYDDGFQSRIATDPSALAKQLPEINSLLTTKRLLQTKLEEYTQSMLKAGGMDPAALDAANQTISAMIDFGSMAKTFSYQSIGGMATGNPKSLINAMQPRYGYGKMFDDMLFGGGIQERRSNAAIVDAVDRNKKALQWFQAMTQMRGEPITPSMAFGKFLFERGITNIGVPLGINTANIRALFNPDLVSALTQHVKDPQLAQDLSQAQDASPDVQADIAGRLQADLRGQGIMKPSPIPGAHTFIPTPDGKGGIITDKYEREAIRNQIDLRIDDTRTRYELHKSLNERKALPYIPKELQLPEPVPLPEPKSSESGSTLNRLTRDLNTVDSVTDGETERVEHSY